MGGWGSRVLNLWKCENTRFLRNFCGRYFRYVTGKSRYFRYVSPKPLRWVGGVRYLGLFPKKNRFFWTPSLTPYQASKTTGTLLFLNEDFTLNIQASPIQGRDGWLLLFPVLRWCQVMSVADVKCFTLAENKKTRRSLLEPFQHKSKVS